MKPFNSELTSAVETFAALMLPVSENDLNADWVWKDHDEEGIRFAFFVTIQELRQLAVELASKRKPLTQAQYILGQYHKQYIDLQSAIYGLSNMEAERAPAENEWSVRQIYAHILGAEINFSAAIRYALEGHRRDTWTTERISEEDDLRITGLTEEQYHSLTTGPLEDMLRYHDIFHSQVMEEFSRISDTELKLPSTFWEETRFPIRHRLHRYEAHIIQHTVQIDKTLYSIGQPPAESKRLIRYLFSALAEVNTNLIGENSTQEGCAQTAVTINSRTMEIKSILENTHEQ